MKYTSSSFQNMDLPRDISLRMKVAVFAGNFMFLFGLIFILFGSGFLFGFASVADFTSMKFNDTDPHTKGAVTNVETTNCRENKINIYKNTVHYKVLGKEYNSDSYSLGSPVQAGDSVEMQYLEKDPAVSRIVGMRKAPFGPWILFFCLIFPAIGLIFFIIGIRRSKTNVSLLKHGLLTSGKVTRTEATSTRINNQRVYKVFFTFTTQDGTMVESYIRTHKLALITDEEKEQLVYDASHPKKAVLIDSLPKSVRGYFENRM